MTINSKISLPDLNATAAWAQKLAQIMAQQWHNEKSLALNAILFKGDLGSGKTTFTREFVQALPQGHTAEVSSPSFTLCNAYATVPKILHCDLYRCMSSLPEELWDALDSHDTLSIIEWSEYLPSDALPHDYLDISFKICEDSRLLEILAVGSQAEALLKRWTDA